MSPEEHVHARFVDALAADGACLPVRPSVPGVSLDAALLLAVVSEAADERGILLGDPVIALCDWLGWPTRPRPWVVLASAWLSGPLSELTRARHLVRIADGLLVRRRAS